MGGHDDPAAAACPDCGTVSGRVHETVLARPRDVRRAADPVDLRWVKVPGKCGNPECPRKTFTEQVPQVPPRCRITARLREQAAAEVTGRGITPKAGGPSPPGLTSEPGLTCVPVPLQVHPGIRRRSLASSQGSLLTWDNAIACTW